MGSDVYVLRGITASSLCVGDRLHTMSGEAVVVAVAITDNPDREVAVTVVHAGDHRRIHYYGATDEVYISTATP